MHFLAFSVLVLDDVSLLLLERTDILPQLIVLFLKCLDLVVHVSLGLIGNERFFQTVGDRAVIQLLQRALEHTSLVAHSDELVASLDTIERDLANDLVEALAEEFFPYRADSIRTSTQLVQLLVQSLL